MLGHPRWKSIITLLTLVVSILSMGSSAGAQQKPIDRTEESWHFGYDLMQMLLEDRGLQVTASLDEALRTPKKSVIVITGNPPPLSSQDCDQLIEFVMKGGTFFLASDNTLSLPGIGRFSVGPVTSANPQVRYQGFSDCLRIDVDPERADFSGVSELVTNRSGWFAPDSVGWLTWTAIASFPGDCKPTASRQKPVLAIGRWGNEDAGLAIVSSDAGLFSNGMMWHGDNSIAAIRVSEMLCSVGQKTKLVFFADGRAMDSYSNRIDMTPPVEEPEVNPPVHEPELKKALRLANAIAKEVAQSNVLNEALKQQPRGVQPSRYFRAFLYMVAIFLLLAIIWALLASGALRAIFLAPRRMRSAYEMREHASRLADDFRNSAGYLARDFCWELTGSRQTADWQRYLAELTSQIHLPSKSLPNGAVLTKAEQHELMRIFDIACRGCHAKMTSLEFQLLGKSISLLRSKHRTRPLVAV